MQEAQAQRLMVYAKTGQPAAYGGSDMMRSDLTAMHDFMASIFEKPAGYMDAAKFKALCADDGERSGVLTMVTRHRAFPEDVALYAVVDVPKQA